MTPSSTIARFLGRSPLIAATLYLVVTGLFVITAGLATLSVIDHVRTVRETSEALQQLRSREVRVARAPRDEAETDPFLEGETLTIASAALLQRVGGAIAKVGGSVQSSQVDITSGEKDGLAGLLINCELDQAALQKLLFDLETGSPMLFIDQIDVQSLQSTSVNADRAGALKVSLNISGRWGGKK